MKQKNTTGGKIKAIRKMMGFTQKDLGIEVGFPEASADVRIAQYESGKRGVTKDRLEMIAEVLGVSPATMRERNINDQLDLLHTLFEIENDYGLKPDLVLHNDDIEPSLALVFPDDFDFYGFWEWIDMRQAYDFGIINKNDYDHWKIGYQRVK